MRARHLLMLLAAALLVPAALAAAKPAKHVKPKRTYEGVTSQGAICGVNGDERCDIALSTSRSGKKQDVVLDFAAPCGSGRTLRSTITVEALPIRPNGKYKYLFELSITLGGSSPGVATGEMLLDGQFKKRRTKGFSKRSELTIDFDNGTQTDCSSEKFTFSAKP